MDKRTGVVVDYFGVFANLAKALNFDENIREEALIDWESLKATVPDEVARCMPLNCVPIRPSSPLRKIGNGNLND